MTTPGEAAGFDVVPIAFEDYRAHKPLKGAVAEAEAVAAAMDVFGARLCPWPDGPRDLTATDTRITDWSSSTDRNSMLLWIGHGRSSGPRGRLYVPGPDGAARDASFGAERFAESLVANAALRRRNGNWAIVVVEACGAGRFAEIVYRDLLDGESREGLLLIGSGTGSGSGYLGQFRRVLQAVYSGDRRGPRLTTNDTEIPLHRLGGWIEEELGPNGSVFTPPSAGVAPLRLVRPALPPLTTSLDVYAAVRTSAEMIPSDRRTFFAIEGEPVDLGEIGEEFVGREGDRAAVLSWLREGRTQVLVVTGPAGSGKSALLNNVLLHAHPRVGDLLLGPDRPGDAGPDPVAQDVPDLDASILLTGMSQPELIRRLAAATGVQDQIDERLPGAGRSGLLAALRRRPGRGLRLVVDGLDDSDDPPLIAGLLAEIGAIPGARLVVGTRPSRRTDPAAEDLLDLLGQGRPTVTVHPLRPDRAAMALYVRRSLSRQPPVLGHFEPAALDRALGVAAERVAASAAGGRGDFLFARLVVQEVVADPGLLESDRLPEFVALLQDDHASLFARALRRIGDRHGAALPALLVLACAQGRGVPRSGRVWLTATNAVRGGAAEVTAADLDETLRIAGPYIMIDFAGGESVHRLAHSTFRATIEAGHPGGAVDLLIGQALVRLAAAQEELDPYVARHLSGHLAQAGDEGWRALAAETGVLDRLPVSVVIRDALSGSTPMTRLPPEIQGLLMSGHLSARSTPADRAGLRALGTARLFGRWEAADKDETAPSGRSNTQSNMWSLDSARVVRKSPHTVLLGHDGPVTGLAVTRDWYGRERLVSTGLDGTVRLWDQTSAVRSDLARVSGGIMGLTILELHAGTDQIVCTAARSPGLRLLDPRTGAETATAGSFPRQVTTFRDGTGALRLAGIEDGGLSVRDALTLDRPVGALVGQQHPVTAIAVVTDAAGRSLVANAAADGLLRLWDPQRRHAVLDPVRISRTDVLAAVTRPDAMDLVLAGHEDGSLSCWDPGTGETTTLPAAAASVSALTAVTLAERPVVALAGLADGSVQCWWGPAEGARGGWRLGPTLRGHDGDVTCVVAAASEWAPAALVSVASGGSDGTVRLWEIDVAARSMEASAETGARCRAREPLAFPRRWDLATPSGDRVTVTAHGNGWVEWSGAAVGEQRHHLRHGPAHCAAALTAADGTEVLALAEPDGAISTWTLAAGSPFGPVLRGHREWIRALAVVEPEEGPSILLSGGDDATVRLWRPGRERALHVVPLDAPVVSLRVLGRAVEVGLTTGTVVVRLETDRMVTERADRS